MIPNLPLLLARLPKAVDRDLIQKAHEAAAEFHAAMARVVMADIELAETTFGDDISYWTEERESAIGAAAVAMEKMPVRWLAVLEVGT